MTLLSVISNILRSKMEHKTLRDAAISVDVLEEETTEAAPPLAVLPLGLDRVTNGVSGHSTAQEELLYATSDHFLHAPVIKFVLNDCIVHPGGVEYSGGYFAKTSSKWDRINIGKSENSNVALYCMSGVSHQYFGHWLRDACPTALLAEEGHDIILDGRKDWPDTSIYANAFGLNAAPSSVLRVKELHVISDFAQGQLKRERYAELKSRLAGMASKGENGGNPVYLRRGGLGVQRLIANEDHLCEQLSRRGFEIVELTMDFTERYRNLSRAPLLVSIDGSHLNQAQFAMKQGSGLISMIPSDRFTMLHRGVAHAMGLRYGCVVVEPAANGYAVSIDELLKTIDLVC